MNSLNHRKRLLILVLASVTLALFGTYVGTYVHLRNRGIKEWKQYDTDGFLYDSTDHVLQSHDTSTHEFRAWVLTPLNFLDHVLFNGPEPIRCLMFELSQGPSSERKLWDSNPQAGCTRRLFSRQVPQPAG